MRGIKQYGVWAGVPKTYHAQTNAENTRSPHIDMKFTDGSSREKEAAINVKSLDADTRLVYWHYQDFQHPVTQTLQDLKQGFHLASSDSSGALSLDFIRTQPQLLNIKDGQVLSTDDPATGDNMVEDDLKTILDNAISQKATIYIFGSSYNTGIHDIHMNQGSLPQFDNGVGEDGALIFSFSDGHFEAVFLAFASQQIPTDNTTGQALPNSDSLADILGADASGNGDN